MAQWKYSINIKQHLGEETSNDAIVKAAKGVLEELKKLPQTLYTVGYAAYDPQLDDMIGNFQCIYADAEAGNPNDECEDLVDEFNYVLSDLYDWADHKRVWLGL